MESVWTLCEMFMIAQLLCPIKSICSYFPFTPLCAADSLLLFSLNSLRYSKEAPHLFPSFFVLFHEGTDAMLEICVRRCNSFETDFETEVCQK